MSARGHLAAMVRTRPPGDPAIDHARRTLAVINTKALLLATITSLDDAAGAGQRDAEHLADCRRAVGEITRLLQAAG
ncbi:hypothetical protein [[Kitasatospora] papulosa]|uniref:hypothetical protein n=1 Tax=[Kitasatospora] papulosa TaxID=1464011 RepID=UPI00369BC983